MGVQDAALLRCLPVCASRVGTSASTIRDANQYPAYRPEDGRVVVSGGGGQRSVFAFDASGRSLHSTEFSGPVRSKAYSGDMLYVVHSEDGRGSAPHALTVLDLDGRPLATEVLPRQYGWALGTNDGVLLLGREHDAWPWGIRARSARCVADAP